MMEEIDGGLGLFGRGGGGHVDEEAGFTPDLEGERGLMRTLWKVRRMRRAERRIQEEEYR